MAEQTAGARVRALRERQGVTLTALAEKAGVSKGYLSQLETGKVPKAGGLNLQRIAVALGVDVDYLLTGADCPPSEADLTPEIRAEVAALPPDLREVARELIRQGSKLPDTDEGKAAFREAIKVAVGYLKSVANQQ